MSHKTDDREFYNQLDKFVEGLIVSMPASYDDAIDALKEKADDLRLKIDGKKEN